MRFFRIQREKDISGDRERDFSEYRQSERERDRDFRIKKRDLIV